MKNQVKFLLIAVALVFSMSAQGQATIDFDILDQLIVMNKEKENNNDAGLDEDDTGSGGSGSNIKIFTDWPETGKMAPMDTEISWASKLDLNDYRVVIQNKSGEEIFNAKTAKTSMLIPLSHLAIDEGKTYALIVKSGDFLSKSSSFEMVSKKLYKDVMQSIINNPDYKSASHFKQVSMKAFGLEFNKFNQAAYKYYQTYMASAEDDNTLRNLRDRFRKENKVK